MNKNEAKEQAKTFLTDYVNSVTVRSMKARGLYNCPLCHSGEGANATGAFGIYHNGYSWKCQKCGKGGDVIDLIGYINKENDFNKNLQTACELFRIPLDDTPTYDKYKDYKPKHIMPVEEQDAEPLVDQRSFFKEAHANIDKTDYLKIRGISKEIAERFNLGFVENWKHPKAENNPNVPATPRLIIPNGIFSYVARDTRKETPEGQEPYTKQKVGTSVPYNMAILDTTQQPVFIVEGEIDALSIYEAGGEAVALSSVANVKKFLKCLDRLKPVKPLLICLDNDNAGREATAKLRAGLKEGGFKCYDVSGILGSYKDPNEVLVNDRKMLEAGVIKAVKFAENEGAEREEPEPEPQAEQMSEEEKQKADYLRNSAYNYVDDFLRGIKENVNTEAISTGFTRLDNELGGGFYEGLYIMGAITSLGKTTLVMQMADQIAESGKDVLIISLEMARNELMARSISRNTFKIACEAKIKSNNAKTTRGITTYSRYANYSNTELELIEKAINSYRLTSQRIYIYEGVGDIGVKQVRELVEKHIKYTGHAPVVIVDYLQILAPADVRATDKQNTDKAVIELKRLSRDVKTPVIAISSLNRQGYNQRVNMESFKESGSIEYSSDVLFSLNLEGIGSSGFNIDTAKSEERRRIELTILKNRNGRVGGKVSFTYYTMFNYFEED